MPQTAPGTGRNAAAGRLSMRIGVDQLRQVAAVQQQAERIRAAAGDGERGRRDEVVEEAGVDAGQLAAGDADARDDDVRVQVEGLEDRARGGDVVEVDLGAQDVEAGAGAGDGDDGGVAEGQARGGHVERGRGAPAQTGKDPAVGRIPVAGVDGGLRRAGSAEGRRDAQQERGKNGSGASHRHGGSLVVVSRWERDSRSGLRAATADRPREPRGTDCRGSTLAYARLRCSRCRTCWRFRPRFRPSNSHRARSSSRKAARRVGCGSWSPAPCGFARAPIVVNTVTRPGALIGEIAVLLDGVNGATVEATERSVLRHAADGKALLASDPLISRLVAVGLAERLNVVTTYLADLKQQYGDAPGLSMVSDVLARLAQGQTSWPGWPRAGQPRPAGLGARPEPGVLTARRRQRGCGSEDGSRRRPRRRPGSGSRCRASIATRPFPAPGRSRHGTAPGRSAGRR